MTEVDLIIKNGNQLLCPVEDINGNAKLEIFENGAVACNQGKIVGYGKTSEIVDQFFAKKIIDATGKVVAPGFVDPHTHPVFFGTRENEFEQRNAGKSYADIAKGGGGIRSSVRNLRKASKQQLIDFALPHLDRFMQYGTTTIEAKSGYGLSLEDEIKSLEVIRELNRIHAIDLIPTFLGAHEIPDEYRAKRKDYIQLIIKEMIPRVAERKLAEFCDIFCEDHVFNLDETETILGAAQEAGLKLKIHADQLTSSGGTELAAKMNAVSADHLDYISPKAIEQIKMSGTIPVLLPGAVFFLGLQRYAPARKLIDSGLSVALATDFNPGSCMTESIPLMMTLGCIYMKMTPAEVWLASTINAAKAISKEKQIGIIKRNTRADLVIWNIPNYKYLPYHFGVNLVDQVIKNGQVIG
ncbi:imidazolonepropionase [candidate division KSB1 bacterium]|nr:imidazolonepropionase [candidate division KSB1 bacterium]MBL7094256.1 imidazolonepropionase [candidate division KSB1 bacterium]